MSKYFQLLWLAIKGESLSYIKYLEAAVDVVIEENKKLSSNICSCTKVTKTTLKRKDKVNGK